MSGSPKPSPLVRRVSAERLRRFSTRTTLNRVLLGAVVVALIVGLGFGTGYTTSKAAFGDGIAFLAKGDTAARINALSNEVDARSAEKLAKDDEKLEVVQVRPDSLWVVNHDTGTVTPLATDTLKAGDPIEKGASSKDRLKLVTGGGQTYLLDSGTGRLEKLDGSRGKPAPVEVPPVTDAVADSDGKVWAYTAKTDELLEIVDGALKDRQLVGGSGAAVTLTMASNLPVLYSSNTGKASMYDTDGLRRVLELGASHGLVSQPSTTSSVVAVVMPESGTLVTGDFQSRRVDSVTLNGRARAEFDRPVVHQGKVYVPDHSERQVVIVEVSGGKVKVEPVPKGPGRFQITARDDRVWVNDQRSPITLSFDVNGKRSEIDAGDADGAEDKPLPTPKPTPSSPPTRAVLPPVTTETGQPRKPQSKVVVPSQTPKPSMVTVPVLTDMQYEKACELIEPELRCVKLPRAESKAETGVVLDSSPQAGARVPQGSAVKVYYRGPLTVPDVTGVPADKACESLVETGLRCDRKPATEPAAAKDQVNVVQSQSPAAGSPVSTGAEVTVVFPDKVKVGTYTGLPVAQACAALEQAGLVCKRQETGPGVPTEEVMSQTPAPGTGLAPGSEVTLAYLGPPVVPDVMNKTPEEACAAIRAVHLECAPNPGAPTLEVNKVLRQDPAAGARHRAGTAVSILYGGTAPVPLNRFKAPSPKRGNDLSPGGGGPAGWSPQSTIGRVYLAEAAGKVEGLHVINRFRCANACGEEGHYYFTANSSGPSGYTAEGPAFACFASPVPGTVPLRALFHTKVVTWAWAPEGSAELSAFTQGGFGSPHDFPVCHVWPRP
ncbi:PASTA domain-containing protein [Nonomuraea sp. NPDC059007]|uniref:PASTA domain-containing protein n=1 Tax=Nonomuraea sp. NPDC059007 TaxID=3346692 RepID=UPI0036A35CF9